MAGAPLDHLIHHLRALAGGDGKDAPADAVLLEWFVTRRDEDAFTTLVQRHGPLVLGVCRRVLANEADAADVFQATFLVLARKAGSIRKRGSLGSWLHGVAYRLARKARVAHARRRAHERQVDIMPQPDPFSAIVWRDLRPVLDEELDHLAENYRAPLVLCYLEGKTHEEAARQLGWTNGTVCGRLARGRELLRGRLTRRGLTLSTGALTTLLAREAVAAVPASLTAAAVKVVFLVGAGQTAAGAASLKAVQMADGLIRSLLLVKVKVAAAVVLALIAVASGAAVLLHAHFSPPPAVGADEQKPGDRASVVHPPRAVRILSSQDPVFAVAFSPDDRMVASGDGGRTIRFWQTRTGQPLGSFPAHQAEISAVAFSPDGQTLASASYDRLVHLWSVATGQRLRTLTGHEDSVSSLAFTPDGRTLASAGWDGTICLWETSTGHRLRTLEGHGGKVWSVAFSGDGRTLASGGGDKTLRLWEVATGRETRRLGRHAGGVYAVAFSPDGTTLASSEDNQVVFWDVLAGAERGRVKGPQTATANFAFSSDGRTVAWSDGDHGIHLVEVATGGERLLLEGHRRAVTCLAFAGDRHALASGSADATTRLWELKPLAPVPAAGDIEGLWSDLAATDPARAYEAIWQLAAAPEQTVPLLQKRLYAFPGARVQIARLVADLDDDAFAVRQRATDELRRLGEFAAPSLRQALAGRPSLEVRRRVEMLLEEIDRQPGAPAAPSPPAVRALEVLELIGNPEARQVLETLAGLAPETRLAREARAGAERLARRARIRPGPAGPGERIP